MSTNRRQFLAASLASARILGANDRIRVGIIGTGGRGQYLMPQVTQVPGAEIVAICDVYELNRLQARAKLAPQAAEHIDYRRILDDKSIDAVVIATPDHWHTPMTLEAVSAGKDVYVEKPVTHLLEENDKLVRAVEASRQVVQTGTQQRSMPHFQHAREIVASGQLGQITFIQTYWYQNYLGADSAPEPIPAGKLDWKLWLGPAPDQPLNPRRFHQWRWFWDFGGGSLTDLFSHWVDVVHWFMGTDQPTTATALGSNYVFPEWDAPDTLSASYLYPNKFSVVFHCSLIGFLEGGGLVFRGTKAMMRIHRSGFYIWNEPASYTEAPTPANAAREEKAVSPGNVHMQNFFDCIRSRQTPSAPVRVGVAAARAAQLGNLALRENRVVRA